MKRDRLKWFILSAIFAAITAVFSQITIPLPLIPITGQTLAVGLTATILGSRYGTLAMLLYVILGAIGLPVFSGASGGLQILIGKTGGYIFGFIVTAYVTGLILEKTRFTFVNALIANIVGMVVTLVFGVAQLKFVLQIPWDKALEFGAYPFLLVGVVKAVIASYVGIKVRERLVSTRMLPVEKPLF
jgi:biotin transport system substrate-specific component